MHANFFSNEDSTDQKCESLKSHAILCFLAMSSYSSMNATKQTPHQVFGDFSEFDNRSNQEEEEEEEEDEEKEKRVGFSKGSDISEQDPDYMLALFYDCKRFDMLYELEKIWKFLTDSYFEPANPTSRSNFDNKNKNKTKENKNAQNPNNVHKHRNHNNVEDLDLDKLDNNKNIFLKKSLKLDNLCDRLVDQNEKLNFHSNANKKCIDNIQITKNTVVKHVHNLEKLADDQFQKIAERIYNSENFSIDAKNATSSPFEKATISKTQPSDLNNILELEKLQNQLILEIHATKQTNLCESAYLYVRFIILIVMANEPSVAHEIKKLSDEKKFENLPTYLKILANELENVPFNTHNATDIIKDYVNSAAMFYNNGYVKSSLANIFYNRCRSD